jgi:hypothetical protein
MQLGLPCSQLTSQKEHKGQAGCLAGPKVPGAPLRPERVGGSHCKHLVRLGKHGW